MSNEQRYSISLVSTSIVVLLSLLLISLEGCARGGFDSEAEAAFREMVGPALNRRALIITTDKRQYKRGEDVVFWVENRTQKALWFPDEQFGVRALIYDNSTRTWVTVDLGVFGITPNPVQVPSGVSGPYWLGVGRRVQPGYIRLLFVGSTDPNAPGKGGEVYATYVDIVELEETE